MRILSILPESWRHRIIRSLVKIEDDELSTLDVKLATTIDERIQASRLLHEMYVRRRILTPQPLGLRFTPHLLAPTTAVFVAKEGKTVVATMALILDSPALGLPMDEIYHDELAAIRGPRRRIAEVGALCVAHGRRRKGVGFLLNKLMWRCARDVFDIDDLVIAVHPDVSELYRAMLEFESFGEVRAYPGLEQRALAVPLHLDLRRAFLSMTRKWGHLGADSNNPLSLYTKRVDPQLRIPKIADLRASEATQLHLSATLAHPDLQLTMVAGELGLVGSDRATREPRVYDIRRRAATVRAATEPLVQAFRAATSRPERAITAEAV